MRGLAARRTHPYHGSDARELPSERTTPLMSDTNVMTAGNATSQGVEPPDPTTKKVSLLTKVYGVICILQGVVAIGMAVLAIVGLALYGDQILAMAADSTLSLVLEILSIIVSFTLSAGLFVFGIFLLRNKRRHAARWAYSLIAIAIVSLVLDMMLTGIKLDLLDNFLQIVILVVMSVTLDPALTDERQLRRKLRRMELRDDAEEGTLGRDETGRGYITLDFFNLFWTFVVCSVLGLLIELAYHMIFVEPGVYQDRAGLLFGPFSPIYGVGAVLMTVALNRFWRSNVIVIFLVSAVIGGAFEFFVSWFMETAFGITAWDYTGTFLSIDGRTNGMYMAMWGALGVVWIKLLLPLMLKLINLIPWQLRYSVTTVCAILMVADALMTLQALDYWYEREAGREPQTQVELFYAEHFGNDYMEHRFQSMTINPDSAARVPGPSEQAEIAARPAAEGADSAS